MRHSFTRPNEVRAKLSSFATETLEAIAEMVIDLEHDLEEMTEERDELLKRVEELEQAA